LVHLDKKKKNFSPGPLRIHTGILTSKESKDTKPKEIGTCSQSDCSALLKSVINKCEYNLNLANSIKTHTPNTPNACLDLLF